MASQSMLGKIARKLRDGDPLTLFVLSLILTALPIIRPLGFPIPISVYTKDFIGELDKLKPGDIVISSYEIPDMSEYLGYTTDFAAVNKYLASKHPSIIFVAWREFNVPITQDIVKRVDLEKTYGYVYGKDYVILPFVPGEEAGLVSFASDIHATCRTDFFGHPIDSLPLMQKVRTLKDANFILFMGITFTFTLSGVRQWATPYAARFVTWLVGVSTVLPYYGKEVKAHLGYEHLAEFEKATGIPGEAMMKLDISNLVQWAGVLWATFFVYLNVQDYIKERRKIEVKKV